MVPSVDRSRVQAIAIKRGIFAIHFLSDDDFLPNEMLSIEKIRIVRAAAGGPGQMRSSRVFGTIVRVHRPDWFNLPRGNIRGGVRRQKKPLLRQQRLKILPEPQGQGSRRPSFS